MITELTYLQIWVEIRMVFITEHRFGTQWVIKEQTKEPQFWVTQNELAHGWYADGSSSYRGKETYWLIKNCVHKQPLNFKTMRYLQTVKIHLESKDIYSAILSKYITQILWDLPQYLNFASRPTNLTQRYLSLFGSSESRYFWPTFSLTVLHEVYTSETAVGSIELRCSNLLPCSCAIAQDSLRADRTQFWGDC